MDLGLSIMGAVAWIIAMVVLFVFTRSWPETTSAQAFRDGTMMRRRCRANGMVMYADFADRVRDLMGFPNESPMLYVLAPAVLPLVAVVALVTCQDLGTKLYAHWVQLIRPNPHRTTEDLFDDISAIDAHIRHLEVDCEREAQVIREIYDTETNPRQRMAGGGWKSGHHRKVIDSLKIVRAELFSRVGSASSRLSPHRGNC